MSKITPISGFPEWLPEEKLAEDRLINAIRAIYMSHGFTPIETPAVELLSTLTSKGVVDKEIYALKRAQAEESEESNLALHFDLTTPFARYVAQHYAKLDFPFRRFQLQKVWRGERAQKGRFREFYQFDIDIIARDELPLACDAEVVTVLDKAFTALNLAPHRLGLNNRKILFGFYASLGLSGELQRAVITAVDKIDKIGPAGVRKELENSLGLSSPVAEKILSLAALHFVPADAAARFSELSVDNPQFKEGVSEILQVLALLPEDCLKNIEINLSLARGLDYYTGTILEVYLPDFPEYGSVGSGGRYENLAEQFLNKKLPGVGVSIGLTRLMDFALGRNLLALNDKCPTKVLVTVYDEAQRPACNEIAEKFRRLGIATEVFYKATKLSKQMEYAVAKGMLYAVFIDMDSKQVQIKNLSNKQQSVVQDLEDWAKASGL